MRFDLSRYSRPAFLLGLITILTISIRLINLTLIPVFADESIYIRWAQVMRAEPSLRFLPLSDGKQPLFMWLVIPFLKIFPDPLVAGRIVSVMAGTSTVIGFAVLSWVLFSNIRLSLLSSLLLVLSPYAFFFDRFALVDSLLTAFIIWAIVFATLTAKLLRLDTAMITGFFLGFAWLTKSPAQIYLILLPIPFALLSPWRKSHFGRVLGKAALLIMTSWLIAFAMYNILRLGPEFHLIATRNQDYVYPLGEVIRHPLDPLLSHFKGTLGYLFYFLTPPIFIAALVGIFAATKKYPKQSLFLLSLLLLPLLAQNSIAKVITARYFLFLVPFVIIFAALGTYFLTEKFSPSKNSKFYILNCAFFIWPILLIVRLITVPQSVSLPLSERAGYFQLWTAGYGIKEAANYLRQQASDDRQIVVGAEGFFGTPLNAIQMYLNDLANIRIFGIGLYPSRVPDSLKSALADNEVYLLINDSRLAIPDPQSQGLRLISSHPKASQPDGKVEHLLFFQYTNSSQ